MISFIYTVNKLYADTKMQQRWNHVSSTWANTTIPYGPKIQADVIVSQLNSKISSKTPPFPPKKDSPHLVLEKKHLLDLYTLCVMFFIWKRDFNLCFFTPSSCQIFSLKDGFTIFFWLPDSLYEKEKGTNNWIFVLNSQNRFNWQKSCFEYSKVVDSVVALDKGKMVFLGFKFD